MRTTALREYAAGMNYLLQVERPTKEGDMDLRAGLRWAGWNPQTQLDEAVEYLNLDFLMGVEPDKLAAYGVDATVESNLNLIYMMRCAIWYHLCNLKNMKTPMEEC